MSDVTRILSAIDQGDPAAAQQLLPLVYDELRKLAAARLSAERPGQTLSTPHSYMKPTFAWSNPRRAQTIRRAGAVRPPVLSIPTPDPRLQTPLLLTSDLRPLTSPSFSSRGHFFAAAAEAMRRILVEAARSKASQKRGGQFQQIELSDVARTASGDKLDLLALDEALAELEQTHPEKAQIVKLRFFTGLTLDEAAQAAGIARATAQRHWTYARAWLFGRLK